jgi:hypothetical protein
MCENQQMHQLFIKFIKYVGSWTGYEFRVVKQLPVNTGSVSVSADFNLFC